MINKKDKMTKIKNTIAGLILLPIMLAIYFIDRAIYSINPFVTHYKFKEWKKGTERIKASVVRMIGLFIIISIITIFRLIIRFFFS